MGISIVITSGKGGVGKTTTTANLGTALAALGKKVVVVDGDTGLRNLDVLMGLENRIVYTIIDVIENRCRLKQALIKDKRYPNLCLLPTAQTKDKDEITGEDYVQLYYTSSEYDELMPIQKDIIKIFNDVRNKRYLSQGSINNPLACASSNGVMLGNVFLPAISGLECISKDMPEDEIFNSQGKINPVIYTQKPYGDYIRYKVITLYR